MKSRYWAALMLALLLAFGFHMAAGISEKQNLRRQALAAAGDDLPYQLYISNVNQVFGDIIYTNDYTLSPATDGDTQLNNLYVRWGVLWGGTQWQFRMEPLTLENVRVIVNTGDAIR